MYVLAFDPGSNFTGWAVVADGEFVDAGEDADVQDCLHRLSFWADSKTEIVVLVEGYNSGGYMTKEAKNTVGVVRTLTEVATYFGFTVLKLAPQARLSAVSEATKYRLPKDVTSALAHALAYSRRHAD